jgi:tetratricopeptide (TPR) repeat protein
MKPLIAAVEKNKENFRILSIAQVELARALFRLARYDEGWELAKQCADAARENNEPFLLADALCLQSFLNIYALRGENKDAILAEGLALSRDLNYKMMLLGFTQLAASDKINSGMLEESIALSEEGIRIARELKAKRWEAIGYSMLGIARTWTGDPVKGEEDFRRCLECSAFVNDQMLPVYALLGCVQTAMLTRQTTRALKLLGTVQSFASRPGTVFPVMAMRIMEAVTQQLNTVPAEQREPALEEGRRMHLDEAVEMAMKPERSVVEG